MSDELTIYDQVEIDDFTFDVTTKTFSYPCPCGDRFQISIYDLMDLEHGEEMAIAVCPSCSLMIEMIYDKDDLDEYTQDLD